MCARSDQPEARDQALIRLVWEAFKRGLAAGDACPDVELVAAYADQGALADSERTRLEEHFADCARCQQILVMLGASLEVAASESVAAPVATSMPAVPAANIVQPSPTRWLWWLSPAFGAAAAALLWMALRPAAPERVQVAADYSRSNAELPRTLSSPGAPQGNAEAPPAGEQRREDENLTTRRLFERPTSEAQAKQETKVTETEGATFAAPAVIAQPAPAARSDVAVPRATPMVGGVAQGVAGTQQTPPAPYPVPQSMNQTVTITEQAPLVNRSSATPVGTQSDRAMVDLPISGRNFAQLNLYTYTFASPGGGVQWRLGAAGLTQKSTDNGQTWQQQASGVTEDLVAGSAASNEVAWVVGRAGVILRTTNGQQWQRIAPPAGVTGDWVTVVVRSANSATVVGPIRRYATEDGGRSWTKQQ